MGNFRVRSKNEESDDSVCKHSGDDLEHERNKKGREEEIKEEATETEKVENERDAGRPQGKQACKQKQGRR